MIATSVLPAITITFSQREEMCDEFHKKVRKWRHHGVVTAFCCSLLIVTVTRLAERFFNAAPLNILLNLLSSLVDL